MHVSSAELVEVAKELALEARISAYRVRSLEHEITKLQDENQELKNEAAAHAVT